MSDKFKNRYRIPSARLQSWDYGSNAAYFITICTKNREHFFGDITDSKMNLNPMGQLAEQFWLEIPNHFSYVQLANFVIMPNHTHGILIIYNAGTVETPLMASLPDIPTTGKPGTKIIGGFARNKNPMIHENISRIIRWYKGRCSFEIRKIHAGFEWQTRFHDHIIRNPASFERIQNYIANNVLNWKEDTFYASI